jgi:hypothetical protein
MRKPSSGAALAAVPWRKKRTLSGVANPAPACRTKESERGREAALRDPVAARLHISLEATANSWRIRNLPLIPSPVNYRAL